MVFTGVSVVDTWLPVCGVSFLRLALHIKALPHTSLASHTLLAKNKAEGSGDRAYNVSFHSPCIGGETYFMCTCYMWMSQVVVRVVEPAMERVPEIVMVAIVCQSLNPSQKQVHMRYVSPPIHGEWNETLYARSPDPSALQKGVARETMVLYTYNCWG